MLVPPATKRMHLPSGPREDTPQPKPRRCGVGSATPTSTGRPPSAASLLWVLRLVQPRELRKLHGQAALLSCCLLSRLSSPAAPYLGCIVWSIAFPTCTSFVFLRLVLLALSLCQFLLFSRLLHSMGLQVSPVCTFLCTTLLLQKR